MTKANYEDIAAKVLNRVLDEMEYDGKTLRAWAEEIKRFQKMDLIPRSTILQMIQGERRLAAYFWGRGSAQHEAVNSVLEPLEKAAREMEGYGKNKNRKPV